MTDTSPSLMEQAGKPKLLVLIGPTAVGKTKLSLDIANRFNAEIISGDSMQVYRGMDIGTAKVTSEERQQVPHHFIDTHEPDEPFSVSDFQTLAKQTIMDIAHRGRLAFIVGGTGLYIESLCYGFQFSEGGMDERFRKEHSDYADVYGEIALHDKLKQLDPLSAERIHPNDRRRVIRALEVIHLTGIALSQHLQGQVKQSDYELCLIGLTMDRALLYERIEARIDEMLAQGLVNEVQRLLDHGFSEDLVSMQGLGYKEITHYIQGDYTYTEAITLLKRNTRRFAKRQLSWFRHMKDIQWVDISDSENFSAHIQIINGIIAGKFPSDAEYTSKQC